MHERKPHLAVSLFHVALKIGLCAALCLMLAPGTASAQSIIKQPGNHPNYTVEIEPHLALQWANRLGDNEGIGPGARFNIPFVHNGPIKTINNSMGISFGMDLTFGDGDFYCWRNDRDFLRRGEDCDVTEFWFPVAMQWNFWLTKVISVFGEPGLAVVHRRWDYTYFCPGSNDLCDYDLDDTDIEFVFWGGGRFMFSDNIGATVRLGFPMITAGLNILL
jgi:hypothetical protein